MTLRARLIMLYSGLVTTIVTIIMFGGFHLVQSRTLSRMDASLTSQFTAFRELLKDFSPPYNRQAITAALGEYVRRQASHLYVQIHTNADLTLFRSPNLGDTFLPDLTGLLTGEEGQKINMGTIRVSEHYLGDLHVQLALPLDEFSALQKHLRSIAFWGVPSVFLTSLIIGLLISEHSLRPLRAMQRTARHISVSNLNQRIPWPRGRGELSDLAKLLNDMFDRLEHAFHQIQRFTADTAHELRTPLTIIRLHSERLLESSTIDGGAKLIIDEQLHEIQHLNDVIERLLVLAKTEAKTLSLQLLKQPVRPFIEAFAEDAMVLAEDAGAHFEMVRCDDGDVTFDTVWLRQVLLNLLHNSLKFGPEHGVIRLTSTIQANRWCVELEDEGPGIAPDHLPYVFDRFAQVDPESQLRSGSGLGLAICKGIVDLHGGHIQCHNRPQGHGLTVRVTLPSAEPGPSKR